MARSRSSGRPWLWPASRKFVPSLPWTSRTPPNAWPPASFPSWKLCEFIPISAASALNPASVNSSSAALRIPSSIASAPTASSSPASPTPPNPHSAIYVFLATRHSPLFSRSPPLFVFSSLATRHSPLLFVFSPLVCSSHSMAVCSLSARTCSLLPSFCRGRALARLFLLRHPLYIDGRLPAFLRVAAPALSLPFLSILPVVG